MTMHFSEPTVAPQTPAVIAIPTHEEIAERAFALYLERGGDDGHDREDWLEAERRLLLGRMQAADLVTE